MLLCVHVHLHVAGYHIYRGVWALTVVMVLPCEQELRNTRDWYTVEVKNDDMVV